MNDTRQKRDNAELFKWDGKPSFGQVSFGQVFPLAAQHVLAAVVGCVTPAILVANAANNAGGNVDMGLLIQVSLVFAALSTLLQLYANKIKLGSGLPVIIGVSFAYVPTMTAIAAQAAWWRSWSDYLSVRSVKYSRRLLSVR